MTDFIEDDLQDITDKFKDCCKLALVPGELLHGNWFSLQYAMFAVEIMDPKLDARMKCSRKPLNVSDSIANGLINLEVFADSFTLLGIIDEQICSLVNWLTGESLSQTVFNSVYMHCTKLVKDPILYAFCECLRFSISSIRNLVEEAGVYEEEDLILQLYGMPLQGPDSRFQKETENGISSNDDLGLVSIDYTTFESASEALKTAYEFLESSSYTEHDQYNITIRLRFIDLLMRITHDFQIFADSTDFLKQLSIEDNSSKNSLNLLDLFSRVKIDSERFLATMHELLATADCSLRPNKYKDDPKNNEYGIPGYDLLLNICNLSSMIPRFIKIVTREDGFVYLTELAQRLLNSANSIIDLLNSHNSNKLIPNLEYIIFVQKQTQILARDIGHLEQDSQKTPCLQYSGSCIYTRSIIKLLSQYLGSSSNLNNLNSPDFEMESFTQTLARFENRLLMEKLTEFLDQDDKGVMSDVIDHCSTIFQEAIKVYCLNRSRQRTLLQNLLSNMLQPLPLWYGFDVSLFKYVNLYGSEGPVDSLNNCGRITFIMLNLYYHLSWDFVSSGFQLDLYTSNEIVLIYAFLIQLFRTTSQLFLRHIHNVQSENEEYIRTIASRNNKKSRKNFTKPTKNLENPLFDLENLHYINDQLKYIDFHVNMSLGSLYLYIAMLRDCGLDVHAQPPSCSQPISSNKKKSTGPFSKTEIEMYSYSDPVEIFHRRVGHLTNNPYIIPRDAKGSTQAYLYFMNFVNDQLLEGTTTTQSLYKEAGNYFKQAVNGYETIDSFKNSSKQCIFMGTPDPPQDLLTVAKKNNIACNLLANASDRRPSAVEYHFSKMPTLQDFPFPNSPTKLQFDFLVSRNYPLIKFAK